MFLTIAVAMVAGAAPIPGYFTQLDFDCGGYVSGFAMHPDGRLYARANVGGVYRSDDHGETWQWLSSELKTPATHIPGAIAVAPGNREVVYQATGTSYSGDDPGRGVWKSTDGGATWRQVLAGVAMAGNDDVHYGGPALLLHPADENEIWTATRGSGLHRSVDAGEHWTRMGGATFNGFVSAGLCIHPRFPDQIWLAGEGGVYVSIDRGVSWTRVRACSTAYRVARFNDGTTLVVGANNGVGFLWEITATDWSRPVTYAIADKSAAFADAESGLVLLAILKDDQTVWAGSHLVTKVSHDRGATWVRPAMAMDRTDYWPTWQRAEDVAVGWGRSELAQDPTDPRRLYLAGGAAPAVTTDGGETWRNLSRGIGEVACQKVKFHATRPDLVFMPALDLYGLTFTDGGRSGFAARSLYTLMPQSIASAGLQMLVQGDDVVALYTKWGVNGARLARAHGDYATWDEIRPEGIPLEVFCDGAIAIDDADDFLVLTGGTTGAGQAGVYRTTDGGRHFEQSRGIPDGLFTGGNYSYFGYNSLHADPVEAKRRYLVVPHRGFFRSDDRGATWSERSLPYSAHAAVLAIDPQRTGRLWAAVLSGGAGRAPEGQGLQRSDDGGSTWTGVGDFSFGEPRLDACGGRVAVFGRRAGDTWDKLYFSDDDGRTWGEITRPGYRFPTLNGVACDPHADRVWLSTSGRSAAVFTLTDDARARDLAINTVNWEGRSAAGGAGGAGWFPTQNGAAGTTLAAGEAAWGMVRTRELLNPGTAVKVEVRPLLASGGAGIDRALLGFGDGWPNTGRFVGLEFLGGELRLFDSAAGGAVRSLGTWTGGAWAALMLTVTTGGELVISRPGAGDEAYAPVVALPAELRLMAAGIDTTDGFTLRTPTSQTAIGVAGGPTIWTQPPSRTVAAGERVTLAMAASGKPAPTQQWQCNGMDITGATGATLVLDNVQPAGTGLYTALVTDGTGAATTEPAMVGLATTTKVTGAGEVVASDVFVPANGRTFDQVLLNGAAAAVTADFSPDPALNQITRLSYIDLDDDIVQVEFSGPGTLSLVLDHLGGPAAPVNYNQATKYMKGHAGIVITGADENSNVTVFSVGRVTAVNQTLFKDDVTYDGIADLAFIAIATTNGKFGGVRTANANFFAAKGVTGVYAPGVAFQGPVFIGNLMASDRATPMILLGSGTDVRITGGDLWQANGRAVQVSGIVQLQFRSGSDSHGRALPAQANRAVLERNGRDVTAQMVAGPAP